MDSGDDTAEAVGFPIRKFSDQSLLAAPRDLTQRATSFIASQCQGIHQMLLSCLISQTHHAQKATRQPRGCQARSLTIGLLKTQTGTDRCLHLQPGDGTIDPVTHVDTERSIAAPDRSTVRIYIASSRCLRSPIELGSIETNTATPDGVCRVDLCTLRCLPIPDLASQENWWS